MSTDLRLLCVRGASAAEVAERVEALLAGTCAPADVESAPASVPRPFTLAVVGRDADGFRKALTAALPSVKSGRAIQDARGGVFFEPAGNAGLAFLFPGQGSQSTGMLLGLRGVVPGFAERLAALDSSGSLLALIDRPRTDSTDDELRDTRMAQPAIGLVSVAIARALVDLGARPELVAGHSYGELAALAIADAWDDATFMRASRARGALFAEAAGEAPGAMAAVFAPRAVVESLLGDGLVLANVNAPEQCVVSGEREAIARLESLAATHGVRAVRLRTACAFHSPKMAPAVARFRALLGALRVSTPRIATYSNVTAAPHAGDVRELLATQIVEPVRWVESIEAMYAAGARVFLETGPGRVLTGLVSEILGARPHLALSIDPGSRAPAEHLVHVAAALVAHGVPLEVARIAPRPDPFVERRISNVVPTTRFAETTGHIVARYFEQQANLVALCANAPAADRRAIVEQALAANERILAAFLEGNGAAAIRQSTTPAPIVEEAPGSEGWLRKRIAELTGFPLETIRSDSDFESDLGLDSLTRTELYAAMVDAIPAVDAHKAAFRTCRTIADVVKLVAGVGQSAPSTLRDELVERIRVVTGRSAQEISGSRDLAEIGLDAFTFEEVVSGLVGSHPQLAVAGRELAHARTVDQLVDLATRVLGNDPVETADDTLERYVRIETPVEMPRASVGRRVVVIGSADDENVAALAREIAARGAHAETITDGDWTRLADAQGAIFVACGGADWDAAVERSATGLFLAAKAQRGLSWLGVITDGSPSAIGAQGVARALAREWPTTRVRAVTVEGTFDAARALDAVAGGRTELDLVLREGRLFGSRLAPAALDQEVQLRVPRDGVVVLLGGGDGIGAEIAVGLAQRFGVSIATIGRTAFPEMVDASREGEVLPARARRLARERALVALKQRIGASFQHVAADATVRAELARAFEAIRESGKPIVGVIHAVGTTEDALVTAKSVESFRRVLHTKTRSLHHLRDLTRDDPLAFALVFSSLAAHTGTAGQTDYVAANEIVGAAAAEWNAQVPYPVRALLWSVWSETGLASAALKRQMSRLGLPGITNERGVAAALAEIERGKKGDAWVLLSPRATLEFALAGGDRA